LLLDTGGETLKNTLENKSKPYLIKPNQDEIADLIGKPIRSLSHLCSMLHSPTFNDIPWIVVTLGGEGAIVKHEEKIFRVSPPKIEVVNPVGSGDAVIAGFASGISKGLKN